MLCPEMDGVWEWTAERKVSPLRTTIRVADRCAPVGMTVLWGVQCSAIISGGLEVGMLLEGCAAVVTGASRGIGKEIALELGRSGCGRIAVNYFGDPAAVVEATVAEIRALGVEVLPVEADIRSSSQVSG